MNINNSDNEKQKILIVDDSKTNIHVLSEILGGNYETHFALRGEEAVALAESLEPDLILLDVMMPDIDGYETLKRIKALESAKGTPVIFVTAMDSKVDEARGLELGAIDYITKPVSPPIVLARVKNHLELKSYQDMLTKAGFVDGLTEISNRRFFDLSLEKEWKRRKRNGGSISLILLDIDFFKAYNDTYGHLKGDDCLKRVAQALDETVKRSGDTLARYGGEEFACILPSTDLAGAVKIAWEMRESVNAQNISHSRSAAADHVTVSIGVAAASPASGGDTLTPGSLIEEADKMLYRAKEKGRNTIVYKPEN